MSDLAIRVDGLSKQYRIGRRRRYATLSERLGATLTAPFRRRMMTDDKTTDHMTTDQSPVVSSPWSRSPEEWIWALKDVSFDVKQGEVVGVIGRNGAGKSTLLKILSRITGPTQGLVEVFGRVGSLLEVGTGFHPELTGRENIYLNGAILGMRKAEIERRFDEIVAFAEVEKFLDTPVRHYSSGMYIRLAFAVAAHLEPEILLVDEVLAVGDASFQKKCLGKMGEVAKTGRTVLFVSHNMGAVQNLCRTAHLLDKGTIAASGIVMHVVTRYLEQMDRSESAALSSRRDRQGNGRLLFEDFIVMGAAQTRNSAVCGSPTSFVMKYHGTPPLQNVHISMGFYGLLGEGALYLSNDLVGTQLDGLPSTGTFICSFKKLPLLPGTYTINLYCTVNDILADWVKDAVRIHVSAGDYFGTGKLPPQGYGSVAVEQQWDVLES